MKSIRIRHSTHGAHRARVTAGLLAIGTMVALAAGAGAVQASATGSTTAKATTVNVTLGTKAKEFALTPSMRSIPAGRVTFVVHNGGRLEHEFVVLKTKIPAGKLPMRPGGKQAKEPGAIGEIEEFGPGLTKRLTLTLKPGHHVLLCNMPVHYKSGQYADASVK